jgi:AraC-like DNA-binding protein
MEQQIAAAITAAKTGRVLDDIARVLWRAAAEDHIGEEAAGRLGEAIEFRRAAFRPPRQGRAPGPAAPTRRPTQRSPDRQRSLERRRRLAASGPLPPALAASFTVAELAVLRIVGDEARARGSCTRSIAEIAARAGVSRTSVQNAIRRAAGLGILLIRERRLTAWRNDTNVLTVISPEWRTWLRLASPRPAGAGPGAGVPAGRRPAPPPGRITGRERSPNTRAGSAGASAAPA